MSRQILFNNSTTVAAGDDTLTNPADVPEGEVALFDADDFGRGTFDLDGANDGDAGHGIENGVFVQGGKDDNETIFSPVFAFDEIKQKQVDEQDYIAPTEQETTITAETGEGFATLRFIRADGSPKPHERITVEVELDDKTAEEIAEEFVDLINASEPDFVTAEQDTDDIVVTANTDSKRAYDSEGLVAFQTATDGEASGWTVEVTQDPNFGSGTPLHVANLEEISYGGNYPNRIYLPVTPPSYAEDENYDLYTILIPTNTTPNISKANKYHQLVIAVHEGGTGIDLDELFFGTNDGT